MASTVSPQSARVPIGYLMDGARKLPVLIAPEWFRFLTVEVFERIGRTEAPTNSEIGTMVGAIVDDLDDLAPLAQPFPAQVDPLTPPFAWTEAVDPLTPPATVCAAPADPLMPPIVFLDADPPADGRLAALEAEVDRLRGQINDMQQSYSL